MTVVKAPTRVQAPDTSRPVSETVRRTTDAPRAAVEAERSSDPTDEAERTLKRGVERVRKPEPDQQARRPRWLAGLVVVVVAVVTASVFVLVRNPSSKPSTSPSSPDGEPAVIINPGMPSVTGQRLSATTIRFRWTYDRALASDIVQIQSFPYGDSAASGTRVAVAPVNQTLTLAASHPACIEVQIMRSGGDNRVSPWSMRSCVV